MNSAQIVDNIFQIKVGDVIQIYEEEDSEWIDWEFVEDKHAVALAFATNKAEKILGTKARVVRKILND